MVDFENWLEVLKNETLTDELIKKMFDIIHRKKFGNH